jgi:hypothetical protein
MTNYLRPDEQASYSEIERAQSRDSKISKGLKLGGAAITGGLGTKIAPFLSEYIPTDLALKGINKFSPKLGEFLKNGMSKGLNLKDGLNFIKENIGGEQAEKKEAVKEDRNIIQQYSPELHQFIDQEVKKGRSPLEAGALARTKFGQIIDKITKDHKTPWSNILESVYGGQGQAQPSQTTQTAQQPQSGQGGPGQQALMAILQKINQGMGKQ